jgi:AcrR family transcriptional regulator
MTVAEAAGRERVRKFQAGEDPRKRAQILAGAYRVFLDMGFDAASMNDITRAAGVSKGTIYVYFKSKDELFEALLEQESARQLSDLAGALEAGADPAAILGDFGRRLARLTTSDEIVQVQRTIIAIATRMPELAQRYYRAGPLAIRSALSAYLRDATRRGALDCPDPARAALHFIDMAIGALVRERQYAVAAKPASAAAIGQAVDAAVGVFVAAYGPRKP